MFYISKDNLPFRREKRERKTLRNSAKDNTQMVIDLSKSITDMAGIIQGLTMQVADLTLMLAGGGDDEEEYDEEEDN